MRCHDHPTSTDSVRPVPIGPRIHRRAHRYLPVALLALLLTAQACDTEENGGPAPDADADVTVDADGQLDASDDPVDDGPDTADLPDETTDTTPRPPSTPYTDSLLLSDRFLNIAHRGGALLAPEETLVAFQNAVDVGADVLELDVHTSSDGVVVVMHDDEVDRTTDGEGLVHSMTFEELRQLDAGYHFSPDGGETFPYRGTGVVIPTLGEVLTAFPEMHFIIEIKQEAPSIVDEVLAVVDEAEMQPRVVVASSQDSVLEEIRAANPDLITNFGVGEVVQFALLTDATEATYEPPGEILQVPIVAGTFDTLDPEFHARAHRLGLRVQIWTINDRPEMERLVQLDIDGIMTDDPVTLGEVIAEAGVNP